MMSTELRLEIEQRRLRFNEILLRNGIDAAVVMARGNFQYLTGYDTPFWNNHSKPFILIFKSGISPSLIIMPAPGEELSLQLFSHDIDIRSYGESSNPLGRYKTLDFHEAAAMQAAGVILEIGAKRVGLELTYAGSAILMSSQGREVFSHETNLTEISDISPLLWELRMRKSTFEVNCIRNSATVQEKAFGLISAKIGEGMTEREISRVVNSCAMQAGADRLAYFHVIADLSARPLGGPTDNRWTGSKLLGIDMCAVVDGYVSDFCRTYSLGKPTDKQSSAFLELSNDLVFGRKNIRARTKMSDIAKSISSKYPALYGRMGHGIGLEQPEPPSIHISEDIPVEESFVMALEPNRFVEGVGFITVEENVLIHEDGCELLSPPNPMEIISI